MTKNFPSVMNTMTQVRQKRSQKNPTHKHRTISSRFSLRGDGNEVDLCLFEKGKMFGSTEEREDWRLMPRPLVIDSGAAETVLPTDWFTGHELKATEESR